MFFIIGDLVIPLGVVNVSHRVVGHELLFVEDAKHFGECGQNTLIGFADKTGIFAAENGRGVFQVVMRNFLSNLRAFSI